MKNIKYNILGFILGSVIFTFVGVYAGTLINGTNISYSNQLSKLTSENVQDAIDELNNKTNIGDATSSDIFEGKKALVNGKIITGTAKSYSQGFAEGVQSVKKDPISYDLTDGVPTIEVIHTIRHNTHAWDYGSGKYITDTIQVKLKDGQITSISHSLPQNAYSFKDDNNQYISVFTPTGSFISSDGSSSSGTLTINYTWRHNTHAWDYGTGHSFTDVVTAVLEKGKVVSISKTSPSNTYSFKDSNNQFFTTLDPTATFGVYVYDGH